MTIPRATATLVSIALMVLLAACDRPKGPPPPKAEAAGAPGQSAPSTVALSGSILPPQPNPVAAKPPSAGTQASTVAGSGSVSGSDIGRPPANDADTDALRDFQAEQERRDRELLDQDLSEAQLRAREDAWEHERANAALEETDAAPAVEWNDGREPYRLPREDGDWTPSDDAYADEPPPDDGAPIDELPYEDEAPIDEVYEEVYEPPSGGYRP